MKKLILFLLLFTNVCFAQEQITKFDDDNMATLNEELRKLSISSIWEIDGTETQLKTADEIDMQSKKIINVTDPTGAQDAATKNYIDGLTSWTNFAWVKFTGADGTVLDGENVTDVTRNDIGDYTINWSITFGNTHYFVISGNLTSDALRMCNVAAQTATTTQIHVYNIVPALVDPTSVYVAAFGD